MRAPFGPNRILRAVEILGIAIIPYRVVFFNKKIVFFYKTLAQFWGLCIIITYQYGFDPDRRRSSRP